MGVNLRDIVAHQKISLNDLKSKTIAVDALNNIYQFLSTIRQPDGTPLMDSQGRTTSHLTGLLYRTVKLMRNQVKVVYVFDGDPPELKQKELVRRGKVKKEAREKWRKARKRGDLEEARKYAKRTSKFTDDMLIDSKKLLDYMGVPWIQAPSEGETQCVLLCERGDAWAVGSHDYDALLFGAQKLVKGLSLSGRFDLELVKLQEVLDELGVTRKQLIDVAVLMGTDFNPGVKGIGPKKGLKAVREDRVEEVAGDAEFDLDEVRNIFLKHPTTDDYDVEFGSVDEEGLVGFLSGEHDFSENRVRKAIKDLREAYKELSQQNLNKWF